MRTIQRATALVGQAVLWTALLGFLLLVGVPRLTSYDVLIVRGGSMEPAIHLGSIIIIDRGAREPTVGDVASFVESDGNIITHRVVGVDGPLIETKGDANRTNDLERRLQANVVGTTVLTIPYVGYGLHVLRQPLAFLLLLLGTGGFLVFGEIRSIAREIRRMRQPTGVQG